MLRRLSTPTSTLLDQLYPVERGFFRTTARDAERLTLIQQIVAAGELAAVAPLLDFLFDRSALIADSTSDAIHTLLETAPPEALLALDDHLRGPIAWRMSAQWRQLQAGQIKHLPRTKRSRTSVLGLISFHPSGYVREQALHLLAQVNDGSELPYLLIRLNDWVSPVRRVAQDSIEKRLQQGSFSPFVHHLFLVLRLAECGRADHTGVVSAVMGRLLSPEHAHDLTSVLRHGQRTVARRCFQLAVQQPGPHLSRLLTTALEADDAVVRFWATQRLRNMEGSDHLTAVLPQLERDRFVPVRREALRLRLELLPTTAVAALERALLDRSPALREFTRFYLRRLQQFNFASFYRQALATGQERETALAGLGETGTREDAGLLLPWLNTTNNRERQAAVRALGRLAGDNHWDVLVNCLADASTKVTRAALQALLQCTDLLDPGRLWSMFVHDQRRHVRLALLVLLDHLETWKRLPYLIRAASDEDKIVAQQAQRYIEQRYHRVFTQPTSDERQQIQTALTDCVGSLDVHFYKDLKYQMGL